MFGLLGNAISNSLAALSDYIFTRVESETTTCHNHIISRQKPILAENASDTGLGPSQNSVQPAQPGIRKPLVLVTLVIAACVLLAIWYVVVKNIWESCSRRKEGHGRGNLDSLGELQGEKWVEGCHDAKSNGVKDMTEVTG